MTRIVLPILVAAAFLAGCGSTPQYKVLQKFPIAGEGTWDYITYDAADNRLFVSHQTQVDVMDAATGKPLGIIKNTSGVHGIALVPEAGKGFATAGLNNWVVIFDLKTLETVGHVPTGTKPDAIVYDDGSRRILVSNGDSNDMTVIDPFLGRSIGPIALGGAPEYIAGDGKGTVWVNLEDKNETLMVDPKAMEVKQRFKPEGCEEPSALAIDRDTRRLFVGCGNKMLAILDADAGKTVQTMAIGEHVDAGFFDDKNKLSFSSTGDGHITVVHEDSPDKFSVVATIDTQRGAKTMAYDAAHDRIYLPTAEGLPTNATGPSLKGKPWPFGQFEVLVVGKQ
jgi:DNA-binding beta-propeller fold protein YncE